MKDFSTHTLNHECNLTLWKPATLHTQFKIIVCKLQLSITSPHLPRPRLFNLQWGKKPNRKLDLKRTSQVLSILLSVCSDTSEV